MSARTSFKSICWGVGQNVRPLARSWVSSCETESDIAKIDNRVGVKLDVVIVSPPVSCSMYDIIIKAADKGSGTVIMDRHWYINECLRQLNDTISSTDDSTPTLLVTSKHV